MRFLDTRQFGAAFGRSAAWARDMCREGNVRYTHEVGRTKRIWIPEDEVERYLSRMAEQMEVAGGRQA